MVGVYPSVDSVDNQHFIAVPCKVKLMDLYKKAMTRPFYEFRCRKQPIQTDHSDDSARPRGDFFQVPGPQGALTVRLPRLCSQKPSRFHRHAETRRELVRK